MSSLDDLEGALRDDAAANAPRASAIDVDAVARAARARRRPRQWAVGTLSVVAVLGFGGLAVTAVTPPTMIAAIESADLEVGVSDAESAPLAEGGTADAPEENEARVGELLVCTADTTPLSSTMSGLDAVITPPATSVVAGEPIKTTVLLTNTTDSTVAFTMRPEATGVVTTDGVVVGTRSILGDSGVEVRLAPKASTTVPVRLETTDCRDSGGRPLPVGSYTAIVVIDVVDSATGLVDSLVTSPVTITLR
jgi:hypothetical protein